MEIEEEDLIEFIGDRTITLPTGKIVRFMPFEFDDWLNSLRESEDEN